MRNLIKKIIHPFLKVGTNIFFSIPQKYTYKGVSVMVVPGVFPPHHTLSTKILLDYINSLNLTSKSFLELGCGSGIISLFASSKGAIVTASDINPNALEALAEASKKNQFPVETIYSDLFTNLSNLQFEYIIINPPYYPKQPVNIKEHAWYCGENFEYFEKLFMQLPKFLNKSNNILMILSEDCAIEKIKHIAVKNDLILNSILEKKVINETNYIFKITFNEKVV